MGKKRRALAALSPAQREIMEILWEHKELSASEVRQLLAPKRQLARNTICTMLSRMEEKGWLGHRESGRTFRYSAKMPRDATIGHKVLEVVETVCGGSPETLLTALLDYRGLTNQELNRIREMLNRAKQSRGSTCTGRKTCD